MANKSQDESKDSHEEILRVARERFNLAEAAEVEIRKVGLEDLRFRAGEQWPDDMKRARELENRPCLTINKLPQFVRQITNDQRQNRPSIKVSPVDDKGDVETGKVFQGLIRHIEVDSCADVAYDTAFEGAVVKGFGYFRIITEYSDPMSFNQDIKIKAIPNSFMVYLDPNHKEPDGSDANWGFVFEDIPKDDYKAQYKDTDLASMTDWSSIGTTAAGWVSDSTVRVAEYFYKEFETKKICLLSTGETAERSEIDEKFPDGLPEGLEILKERDATVPIVKWCKINGIEVTEETDWLGKWIPIIPVYGDILNIEGEKIFEGIVRHAKDPQKMNNFWASSETETIALAPKAPWIMAEGQDEGYENMWRDANVKTQSRLIYKPTTIGGMPVGAPQRNAYEPPVNAITNARMQSAEDLKATTGIYDSSLGARSNETSGVAIRGRQHQAQTSNFHFIDNLTRSLRHAGRILVDLIPKVYDTAQAIRTIGEEGEQEIIRINEMFKHRGEEKIFRLDAGKYDVVVETGPSYQTKRQEAAASMMDFMKAMPQQAAIISDLMVKNMDWNGASEISERLKKTLPPGIAENPKEQKPLPPEVTAQMQQMDQMVQQLTAKVNEQSEVLKNKTIELESKERIEFAKLENALALKQMDLQGAAANAVFGAELAGLKERLNILGVHQPFPQECEPPQGMGQPNQNQEITAAPPDQTEPQLNPNPTGGPSPGQFME